MNLTILKNAIDELKKGNSATFMQFVRRILSLPPIIGQAEYLIASDRWPLEEKK